MFSKKKKVFTRITTVFSAKIRQSQKKMSSPKFSQFFCGLGEVQKQTPIVSSKSQQLLHNFWSPIPLGEGLFSFLEQKSASKALKNVVFCILFRLVVGNRAPLPGYTTVCSAFAVSLSAFAVESPTSKKFSTCSKIFQFAAQSSWSRTAVVVGSQYIRHQIDGDCTETALRTHGDCSTILANARRLRCESY